MLDELETGPWPSFISGIKKLRDTHPESRINEMTNDLLGQLEHSYETRKGYWKGGTVSVYGYGGGIIPRFSEVGDAFPQSKEFHTLRVQPPAGNYYTKTITGATAFTFTNVPTSVAYFLTIEVTCNGSNAATWPASVKWPADTAPAITDGKTTLFMFVTDDGGTRWRGSSLADYTN